MSISLETIRIAAADVVSKQYENLEVVGVRGMGDGEYAEIHLIKEGCEIEPCRVTLGVFRDIQPDALRTAIADALRHHLTHK